MPKHIPTKILSQCHHYKLTRVSMLDIWATTFELDPGLMRDQRYQLFKSSLLDMDMERYYLCLFLVYFHIFTHE